MAVPGAGGAAHLQHDTLAAALFISSVLRAFSASNACFARDEASSDRVGVLGLGRKPPKLRSRRCTQPRAAKAMASVAVVGN